MLNSNALSGLPVATSADGWVYIQTTSIRTASNQTKYLAWSGFDIMANPVMGTLFENNKTLPVFKPGDVAHAIGVIGESKGSIQVWATHMGIITDVSDLSEFKNRCLPTVPADELQKYIIELKQWSTAFTDPSILKLSQMLFEYMEPHLTITPAAKKNHEALRGGLAKHTWEVLSILNNQLLLSKGMDMNVVFFCALYHDIGKVKEYTGDMTYAPEARLVSHAVMALELIAHFMVLGNILVDTKTINHIRHCILAHHGQFGDIKPATREALAVHHADYMVSSLGHIEEAIRTQAIADDGWGNYSQVLSGYAYVPQMDNR